MFCRETQLPKFEFVVSKDKLKKGLCGGVKLDVYFPGFPTLKHIEHTVSAVCFLALSGCEKNFFFFLIFVIK